MVNMNSILGSIRSEVNGALSNEHQENIEGFTHLWTVALQWMVQNAKKKLSAKVKNRLECLNAMSGSLYSKVLGDPSSVLLHCIELCTTAISAKSDKEFLEDISGFTNAEACGMLGAFHNNAESSIQGIANYCIESKRLTDFLEITGINDAETPDIADLILEALRSNTGLNTVDMTSLDVNRQFLEEFGEKFTAIQGAMQCNITLNNATGVSSIDDMAFTMLVNSLLILVCKVSALPVVKDGLDMDDIVRSVVKVANKFTSKKEADKSITKVLDRQELDKSCSLILSLLAGEFAVNNVVALWHVGSTMPSISTLKEIYNRAGLLLHDGEDKRMLHAEWSEFAASFYNTLAEYFTDLGHVHEDISDILHVRLKEKKKPNTIERLISGEEDITESFKYMAEHLPAVALSAIPDSDSGEVGGTRKKRVRKGKKLPK